MAVPSLRSSTSDRLVISPSPPRSSASARSTKVWQACFSALLKVMPFHGRLLSVLAEVLYGVAKELHAIAFGSHSAASPLRVLCWQHMSLRVRHHPQDTSTGITKSRNTAL